jgi:hypothetical protein
MNIKILVRKPEEKRLHGRPRCRLEGNMKMDLKETGCNNVVSSCSRQGPVAGSCECGNELSSCENCKSCTVMNL